MTWNPKWAKEPPSSSHYREHRKHLPFLYRAIAIAGRGRASVEPNPRVGALLVHQNHILGEAFHQHYGGSHAERILYHSLRDRFHTIPWEECTLYVSLEPCNHYGKQPPCTELILQHSPGLVVVCDLDPNPIVCGQGIQRLKDEGLSVLHLPLPEARWLNRHFYVNVKAQRPYITLKWAQSRNAIMGSSKKRLLITDSHSQFVTHDLRAEHQAILIGANTLRIDTPQLTTRFAVGPSPQPIVLSHRLPENRHLQKLHSHHSKVIILNTEREGQEGFNIYLNIRGFSLRTVCQRLYEEYQIGSILVEGGYQVITSFLEEGIVDEIFVLMSQATAEGDIKAPLFPFTPAFECIEVRRVSRETIFFHFVSKHLLEILELK